MYLNYQEINKNIQKQVYIILQIWHFFQLEDFYFSPKCLLKYIAQTSIVKQLLPSLKWPSNLLGVLLLHF